MYELGELEKKWVAYKKQKYKKIGYLGASFAAVALLSFGAAYILFANKSAQNQTADANTTKQRPLDTQPVIPTPATSAAVSIQQPQKEIVIISPEEKKEEFKSFQPTEQSQNVTQTTTQQPQQRPVQAKVGTAPKITIETKNVDPIDALAEKYAKNPDAQTALSLSELLYKRGSYQKALKWAINANSLDPKNEKSWIMFAKSSYKLGRKQDAINALENFSRTNPSDAVKETISHIKNDEY
ncbi:MAG: CDC27 family protein [Campylobacteraceae bacterium]|jgi:tetratricopeptide (TPR) repeat protein|nr:CDC27 family protein [Campylobacteraceae bacterium]